MGIDLSSQDSLLKNIGGLHSYLRHTILMFNPTKLDEVCVQATHLEARGRMFLKRATKIHSKVETKERGNSKEKGRRMLQ